MAAAVLGLFKSSEQPRCSGSASLEDLHRRLRHLLASPATGSTKALNQDDLVQVILQITEALIADERHGETTSARVAYDRGLIGELVQLLGGGSLVPKAVQVQLLQTFNMLVQNVRMDKSMEYLFGSNCVNRIITTQLDWQNEEILAYYVTLLKSLAMRLDNVSLKYFFDTQTLGFPLYTEAVRFFCHRDHMVRASVRTLTLQIYRLEDNALRHFVLEHSSSTYFVHLACHLCELWVRLDNAVQRRQPRRQRFGGASVAPQEVNEQQQDLLIYLSDVMELGVQGLTESLAEQLLRYCLLPVLLGSLLPRPDVPAPSSNVAEQLLRDTSIESEQSFAASCGSDPGLEGRPRLLSPPVALFLLHQVFHLFRTRAVLEPLAAALLLPCAPPALVSCCLQPPLPFPPTFRATTSDICGPSSGEFASRTFGGGYGPRCKRIFSRQPHGDSTEMAASRPSPAAETRANGTGSVRQHFLKGLSSRCNAQVLLTAGVVHLCATRHREMLQTMLERARMLPPSRGSARQSTLAVVGARLVERLGRPPSVEEANSLQDTFERLDSFLDEAIEATTALHGSPNVLTEVQNLTPLLDLKKFKQHTLPRTPSTSSAISDTSIETISNTHGSVKIWDDGLDETTPSGEHPLEVLLCTIRGLEQHIHLGNLVVRVLAKVALDLSWNSVDRPDLLTAPVWMAGRVEQSAAQEVSKLFHDVPGREAQIRMLSSGKGQSQLDQPIAKLCSDTQWLLDSSWTRSMEGQSRAGKALESLSVIRQVHADIIEYTQSTPPQEARACNAVATISMPKNRFKPGSTGSTPPPSAGPRVGPRGGLPRAETVAANRCDRNPPLISI